MLKWLNYVSFSYISINYVLKAVGYFYCALQYDNEGCIDMASDFNEYDDIPEFRG